MNKFIFYLHFDTGNDSFDDIEFISNIDLFVGDYLDLSDSELLKSFDKDYGTAIFQISKRMYTLDHMEMHLHLKPIEI